MFFSLDGRFSEYFWWPQHKKSQSPSSSSEAQQNQSIPPLKKLEHQKNNKLLSLDPQSNHRHHLYPFHHFPHQNPLLNSRHVEQHRDDEDQDSSLSPSPKDPALHFHLQYLQQNHSYAGLDAEQQSSVNHLPKKRSYLLPPPPPVSSSSLTATVEYATKIGESGNHHQRPPTKSSRLAMRGGVGEIVEVQGGHIVRSTGRKDRHSKVCTAKGPRDRRVRLSAHTAIQFYDVQDRLGYDRPSKAVDWLIKNAKTAIDELAELPAWNPNTVNQNVQQEQEREQNQLVNENANENKSPIGVHHAVAEDEMASGSRETSTQVGSGGRMLEQLSENPNRGGSGFLPPSLGTDIADSIKSFFPIVAPAAPETNSSSIDFRNYAPDLVSRTSGACQNQDLRLSLQSFQDPILLHQAQTQTQHHHHQHQQNEQLFSATTPLGFDGSSFPEEQGRLHRMQAWNGAAAATDTGYSGHGGGGFFFNLPSPMPTLPPLLFGQSQYLTQRGPLQSSNNPSIRAWIDSSTTDYHHHHQYLPPTIHHQSSIAGGIGFDSSSFSGFRIPARIQGEEEHDGVSDKPSSASSDSRH
ncbi:hypothetical protein K1719_032047 [Acacia pycnantha]|nr:hypothetical protein K1719_032047 [Acacia pycnantha]